LFLTSETRFGVAQIFNLPYRRIAFGWALKVRKLPVFLSGCGLKIRDTAG
jgi:hypothetical protein